MLLARTLVWVPLAFMLMACQSDPPAAGASAPAVGADRVEIRDNAFIPPAVQVPAGTVVTWSFTDGERRHNVVGDGFESEVLSNGTFAHAFHEPGTHTYRCTLHAGMEGEVVVTGADDVSSGEEAP